MYNIHSTSIIDSGARIAESASVGPFCYIGPKVTIGAGAKLISHVYITGRTMIGEHNTIWPHTSLGADPQDLKYQGEDSELIVGDHNDIRESVTIHKGTVNGGGITRIGNHNLFMAGAHIAHDNIIGNHIVIANAVQLAGHTHIRDHVIISGATAVHHYITIGQYAFVGGMTRVVHDVPPFMIVEGNPSRIRGVNVIGLERNRVPAESITHLKTAYRTLFRNGEESDPDAANTVTENLIQLERECGNDQYIDRLIHFLRNTSIGVYGRYREIQRRDDRHHNPAK